MRCPICNLFWPAKIACFVLACNLLVTPAHAQQPTRSKPRQGEPDVQPVRSAHTTLLAPMSTNEQKPFGKTKDGKDVSVFTLTNGHGTKVRLIDYGATLISVETPDKRGKS